MARLLLCLLALRGRLQAARAVMSTNYPVTSTIVPAIYSDSDTTQPLQLTAVTMEVRAMLMRWRFGWQRRRTGCRTAHLLSQRLHPLPTQQDEGVTVAVAD